MRSSIISLLGALALLATSEAFAPAVVGPRLALRGATSSRASAPLGGLCMQEGDQGARRVGASVDADGKSNVWAVEPKMQVQDPKSEDKPNPILAPALLVGGLGFIGAILAFLPVVNPEQ